MCNVEELAGTRDTGHKTCDIFVVSLTSLDLYHGPDVSRPWSCGHPVGGSLIDSFNRQEKDMSQPGPGTAIGDELHFLQTLWSRENI